MIGHVPTELRLASELFWIAMPSSRLRSLEKAGALLIVIDLFAPAGSALAKGMANMEPEVDAALPVARLLRCRFLLVVKVAASSETMCLPCFDREALQAGVRHGYLLASEHTDEVGTLVMPDALAPEVFTQITMTRMERKASSKPGHL